MKVTSLVFTLLNMIIISSCAVHPKGEFDAAKTPPAPDFSKLEHWAAHPDKSDPADRTPNP
ncbi:MAG: hypothetical protein JNJ57_00490, partial [Saprospiraceae bacterium]|nr:hypothetical protein [Saprospiraceae bacterium]